MTRLAIALIAGGLALCAAAPPLHLAALSDASPGLWELRRVPDGKPLRECVSDVVMLAQVEHRGRSCAPKLVSSDGTTAVLRYQCPAGGFGQSKLTLLTPRSLTIETQGISHNLPFNYVVHARRVGDCAAH